MIRHNPHLDQIITIDRTLAKSRNPFQRFRYEWSFIKELRAIPYDLSIDFEYGQRGAVLSLVSGARCRIGPETQTYWRNWIYHERVSFPDPIHAVERNLAMLEGAIGLKTDDKSLELFTVKKDDVYIARWMRRHGFAREDQVVVCHPGARWWFKQWPAEKFARLADQLQEEMQLKVLFSGGQEDVSTVQTIADNMVTPCYSIAGETTPLQFAALAKRAKLFIGNDSGPMHIAAAVGTPVIALFGPTEPAIWSPWSQRNQVVYKGVSCSPCDNTGCDMGELNCMRQIGVSEVVAAVNQMQRDKQCDKQVPLASY